MDIFMLLTGAILAILTTWLISRHYYRQAALDAGDGLIAQRLDACTEGDKTFMVALAEAEEPIPRYALINVEFQTIDGRTPSWGSNTSIMACSLKSRGPHSLLRHSGSDINEDRHTISLSERGRQNADYLLRKEYHFARFTQINDSESVRLGLFRAEHNRDPRPRGKPGLSVTTGG